MREQLLGRMPAIVKKLEALALAGDVQAARTLLERVLPAIKPEPMPVQLPEVAAATSSTQQAALVIQAVARGEITTDAAAQLLTALGQVARIAEVEEMEKRIKALEAAQEKKS